MLVFDRRSLRCVVPPTEDCDIPTTPTPIEGDNQNENDNESNQGNQGNHQGNQGNQNSGNSQPIQSQKNNGRNRN